MWGGGGGGVRTIDRESEELRQGQVHGEYKTEKE